jgi:hypothetical protein
MPHGTRFWKNYKQLFVFLTLLVGLGVYLRLEIASSVLAAALQQYLQRDVELQLSSVGWYEVRVAKLRVTAGAVQAQPALPGELVVEQLTLGFASEGPDTGSWLPQTIRARTLELTFAAETPAETTAPEQTMDAASLLSGASLPKNSAQHLAALLDSLAGLESIQIEDLRLRSSSKEEGTSFHGSFTAMRSTDQLQLELRSGTPLEGVAQLKLSKSADVLFDQAELTLEVQSSGGSWGSLRLENLEALKLQAQCGLKDDVLGCEGDGRLQLGRAIWGEPSGSTAEGLQLNHKFSFTFGQTLKARLSAAKLQAASLELALSPHDTPPPHKIKLASPSLEFDCSLDSTLGCSLQAKSREGEVLDWKVADASATLAFETASTRFEIAPSKPAKLKFQATQITSPGSLGDFKHSAIESPELTASCSLDADSTGCEGSFSAKLPSFSSKQFTLRDVSLRSSYRLEQSSSQAVTLHLPKLNAKAISLESFVIFQQLELECGIVDALKQPRLEISSAKAGIFDGQLSLIDASYQVGGSQCQSLAVDFLKIDGAKLIELYASEDLTFGGRLSGRLPFTLCPQARLSMRDGSLRAEAPGGTLSYTGQALPDSSESQQLMILRSVLKQLSYTTLQATAQLSEEGELALALQVTGKSPYLNQKTPITLNLNVQENIPALIESLRLASGKLPGKPNP